VLLASPADVLFDVLGVVIVLVPAFVVVIVLVLVLSVLIVSGMLSMMIGHPITEVVFLSSMALILT
jgi:hypothetical protein